MKEESTNEETMVGEAEEEKAAEESSDSDEDALYGQMMADLLVEE